MKKRVVMLALLSLDAGIVCGDGGYPGVESPASDSLVVTGTLVFVATNDGKDRALLCRPAMQVPRDYSTCINLSGAVPEQLWPGAACIELTGAYTPYASGLIYTGSVGMEFGMLAVTKSGVCESHQQGAERVFCLNRG